jgi:hypothetical protein
MTGYFKVAHYWDIAVIEGSDVVGQAILPAAAFQAALAAVERIAG